MNQNINLLGNGCRADDNHWVSAEYPLTRSHSNTYGSTTEDIVTDIDFRTIDEDLDRWGIRCEIRSDFCHNPRYYPKDSLKRSNNMIAKTFDSKRLRIRDPWDSPNARIKDFRLNRTSMDQKVDNPSEDLFCRFCNVFSRSFGELAEHLKGSRHQMNQKSDTSEERHRMKDSEELYRLLDEHKLSTNDLVHIRQHLDDRTRYQCILCDCHRLPALSVVQHIKGFRHKRKVLSQKREEIERHLKSNVRRRKVWTSSSLSSVQNSKSNSTKGSNQRYRPNSKPNERARNDFIPQTGDSLKKTIENFRRIRGICDQMIDFYEEKEKSMSSRFNPSVTITASTETMATNDQNLLMKLKTEK